jgi:hypothetical protein
VTLLRVLFFATGENQSRLNNKIPVSLLNLSKMSVAGSEGWEQISFRFRQTDRARGGRVGTAVKARLFGVSNRRTLSAQRLCACGRTSIFKFVRLSNSVRRVREARGLQQAARFYITTPVPRL